MTFFWWLVIIVAAGLALWYAYSRTPVVRRAPGGEDGGAPRGGDGGPDTGRDGIAGGSPTSPPANGDSEGERRS